MVFNCYISVDTIDLSDIFFLSAIVKGLIWILLFDCLIYVNFRCRYHHGAVKRASRLLSRKLVCCDNEAWAVCSVIHKRNEAQHPPRGLFKWNPMRGWWLALTSKCVDFLPGICYWDGLFSLNAFWKQPLHFQWPACISYLWLDLFVVGFFRGNHPPLHIYN